MILQQPYNDENSSNRSKSNLEKEQEEISKS